MRVTGRITSCATLALLLVANASPGSAQGTKMSDVADQLRTALAGDPVMLTQQGPVTLTSSADAMFPSAGWELKAGVPVLSKIVPTLSKLQHTEIVVGGYTDDPTVAHNSRAQEFQTISTCRASGQRAWWFISSQRCKSQPVISSMFRGDAPRCTERHARGKGEEPACEYHPHRGWHLVRHF